MISEDSNLQPRPTSYLQAKLYNNACHVYRLGLIFELALPLVYLCLNQEFFIRKKSPIHHYQILTT